MRPRNAYNTRLLHTATAYRTLALALSRLDTTTDLGLITGFDCRDGSSWSQSFVLVFHMSLLTRTARLARNKVQTVFLAQ